MTLIQFISDAAKRFAENILHSSKETKKPLKSATIQNSKLTISDESWRPEDLSTRQLEEFKWETCRNIKALNLCFCGNASKALLEILPKTLSKLHLNISSTDLLDDMIWLNFPDLKELHINGPWDSEHEKVNDFNQKNISKDFTFTHPENKTHHNMLNFRNGEWQFQYFK